MYQPTTAEVRRARRLTKCVTPSRELHDSYLDEAGLFLGVADLLPFVGYKGRTLRLEAIRWHRSVLFEREYLLAHVDDLALGELAPECDAIATLTSTIPLVLVPLRRRRSLSETFLSILEHEFVHVNQVLLGAVRQPKPSGSVAQAIADFSAEALLEHDANFIQLATWPRLFPRASGVSLEHWCALRGWTAALESAVLGAFCRPRMVPVFLSELGASARAVVEKMGASKAVTEWFVQKHVGLVRTAVELHLGREPTLAASASLRSAASWVNRSQRSASAEVPTGARVRTAGARPGVPGMSSASSRPAQHQRR